MQPPHSADVLLRPVLTFMSEQRPSPPILRITLCVITRRRPAELQRLLGSLERLRGPAGTALSLLVVENDEAGSEGATTRALATSRLPTRHVFEPRVGIPFARNRCLDEAAAASDYLVFLDDDETVDPALVERLLATARATDAAIVTGPALPAFPPDAPAWAARSGAYDPPRYATGAPRPFAYTNNVLFAAELVRDGAARFDESMRYTGGSDKEFFARLARAGHRIVWADDAVTFEWYPRERLTRRWLFQRALRLGTVARRTDGAPRARMLLDALRFAARAAWRAGGRPLDPSSATALAAWDIGRAVGLVLGAAGIRYYEYKSR